MLKEMLGDDSKNVLGIIKNIKTPTTGYTGKGVFRTINEQDLEPTESVPRIEIVPEALSSKESMLIEPQTKKTFDTDHIDKYCRP